MQVIWEEKVEGDFICIIKEIFLLIEFIMSKIDFEYFKENLKKLEF